MSMYHTMYLVLFNFSSHVSKMPNIDENNQNPNE